MWLEFALFVLVLICLWRFFAHKHAHNGVPPGPVSFPLIGNLVQILLADRKPYLAFKKLADKYGDVMQISMGVTELVIISSVEAAQEICAKDTVTGRFQTTLMLTRTFGKNIGFFFSGGEFLKTTKRFVVRNLRNHGFGKSASMERLIADQSTELVERLEAEMKLHGKVESSDIFGIPVLNVLWGMVVGESFTQDDARLRRLLQIQESTVRNGDFGGGISMCWPALTRWFPKITGLAEFGEKNKTLQDFIREIMDARRRILAENQSETTCFLDVFLTEIEKCKAAGNEDFSEEHGIVTVMDLFTAGGETSSTVLTFCVLYAVVFPQIQKRMQLEIDSVLENRHPTIDEMEKLHYTRAVILEVMRHAIVVPFPPPRTSSADVIYNGKIIRKGIPILVNLAAMMMDRKTWTEPQTFNPERFLTAIGQFDVNQYEKLQNFGFGHRRCPGQRLAESIMFIFFVQILQNFQLESFSSEPPSLEPQVRFTISSKPFILTMKKRVRNSPSI